MSPSLEKVFVDTDIRDTQHLDPDSLYLLLDRRARRDAHGFEREPGVRHRQKAAFNLVVDGARELFQQGEGRGNHELWQTRLQIRSQLRTLKAFTRTRHDVGCEPAIAGRGLVCEDRAFAHGWMLA